MLCDDEWQQRQTSLDLEWALGTEQPSLENKRWACCARLLAALPQLHEMTLLGTKVDLDMLKGGRTTHRTLSLDVRNLRSAMWHMPHSPSQLFTGHESDLIVSPACSIDEIANAPPANHMANRVAMRMAKGRTAVQISAVVWLITHSPTLQYVDLSGLVPQLCSNWPSTAVRAIAAAVYSGAPCLRSLVLVSFDAPIDQLRTPPPFLRSRSGDGELDGAAPPRSLPPPHPPTLPRGTLDWGATLNFEGMSVCVADLILMCNAADELPHVEELLLSSNHFGDNGLLTLLDEVPISASRLCQYHAYVSMRDTPSFLLPNLRWLALNDCRIGDTGVERIARAVCNGAFFALEQICLVSNCIGDAGLGAIADAAVEHGAFVQLAHLNVGSNEITDLGVMHLSGALRCGALPALIHLSFGLNQLGNASVVALTSATADPGCLARLEYLGLGANRVGDEGARALSSAMVNSAGLSQLHGLWLAENAEITDAGAIALASGLRHSSRLKELYLHGLSIGNEGLYAFIQSVSHLHELRRCVLGRASPEAQRRIQELQTWMRETTNREDIIISSWPQLEGGYPGQRRKPQNYQQRPRRVQSSLRSVRMGQSTGRAAHD